MFLVIILFEMIRFTQLQNLGLQKGRSTFKYDGLPIAYHFYSFSQLPMAFSSFIHFILNGAYSILNDWALYMLWAYFMQTFLSIFLRLELDKCCAWEAKSGK